MGQPPVGEGQAGLPQGHVLKPFHQSVEFCGTCHKVHLPAELNGYSGFEAKPLRRLSPSEMGHGITSFYYPPKA